MNDFAVKKKLNILFFSPVDGAKFYEYFVGEMKPLAQLEEEI